MNQQSPEDDPLRGKGEPLSDQARDTTRENADDALKRAQRARVRATAVGQGETGCDFEACLQAGIRSNPYLDVAIAFGAGLLTGVILAR